MWTLIKLFDAILLIYFIVIAFAVPLLDAQTILPSSIFPEILISFKNWFTYDFDNYLLSEKPRFFIGIAWLELLFAWPLSIASIYAILAGKNSWLTITYDYSRILGRLQTILETEFTRIEINWDMGRIGIE
ncbi:uncharacterized protein [Rutidosis leptorrhynchoides]|uniref:uncharacterized protein n=1 Tax=Rutidosis leptorrhynchoides TaxID=125765 RepID=UPI003A99D3EC